MTSPLDGRRGVGASRRSPRHHLRSAYRRVRDECKAKCENLLAKLKDPELWEDPEEARSPATGCNCLKN